MEKDDFMGCKIKKQGVDKDGRAILEFSGNINECKDIISSLVSNKGVVIELSEED